MESKVVLSIGNSVFTLKFNDFEGEMDVDDLMKIHYENLYSEIVTVSALLNKIGLLKAEAEKIYSLVKLDRDIYEANTCKRLRREANINSGKFTIVDGNESIFVKLTEKSLEEAVLLDPIFQNKQKIVIEAKKNMDFVDSLYWGCQSKDRKLSVLMKPVTPEEFCNEIVEGVVNGILIKKIVYKT